jgi:2-phosphosulfolactate phosphatase
MSLSIEVLLNPAEYQARATRGFAGHVCVVFDVLRATSVMVTGLANGVAGFLPVAEIAEAMTAHQKQSAALLAGEREGLRITAAQSGGVGFDLGNSPLEYTADRVSGHTIITTTTNGTRALRACASAEAVVVGSFLNLMATSKWLALRSERRFVLVCAGTGEGVALEDVLGAGALCELMVANKKCDLDDAALLAHQAYRAAAADLFKAVSTTKNGRRLMANPDLRNDVVFCLRRDVFDLVGVMGSDGVIRTNPQ